MKIHPLVFTFYNRLKQINEPNDKMDGGGILHDVSVDRIEKKINHITDQFKKEVTRQREEMEEQRKMELDTIKKYS